ncbi:hypothetical protein SDC9_135415 [bioreactor metagenome]|uniref:Uncharacterized protein n=1 Tax=bioreactor metagenome TaxID=1076179 RepID=A0A645DHL6_9ZZZZ
MNTTPFNDMFINNFPNIFGFYLRIESVIGKYFHNRPFLAKSKTSGFNDLDIISQTLSLQFILQHFVNQSALRRLTTGSRTNEHVYFVLTHKK